MTTSLEKPKIDYGTTLTLTALDEAAVIPDVVTKQIRRGRRVRIRPGVLIASCVLILLLLAALFPSLLAPYDPLAVDPRQTLTPPSSAHLLGTDENGRDVLSRIIFGSRNSLLLGFGAITIALIGGSLLGLAAGLGNKLIDGLVMRTVDVGLAFPELLLALVVVAIAGGGTVNALLAIGIASIPNYARLVRAQTLSIRSAPFIEAARATGLSNTRVMFRHVLPNAAKPVLVLATIGVGTATVAGAALSFLGLGTTPPTPEWGSMLASARNFIGSAWWYGVFPGAAITSLVLCSAVLGRHLQQRLEGRTV